jgi:hypothetical protein
MPSWLPASELDPDDYPFPDDEDLPVPDDDRPLPDDEEWLAHA